MPKPKDTLETILEAARRLVNQHSYATMTVDEICTEAGVLKGSFYHFFKSKHDLMLMVLERQRQLCLAALFAPAFSERLPPLARVERVFDLLYQQQREARQESGKLPGCLIGNLALEMSTQDEALRTKAREIFDDFGRYFAVALSSATDAAGWPPTAAAALAQQLVAFLEGVLLVAKVNNDPELIRQHAAGALALARQAIVIPAPSVASRRRRKSVAVGY